MTGLRQKLQTLAEQNRLVAIYAFGSRADEVAGRVRGEPVSARHPGSDIDLGVQPRPGIHLSARQKVEMTLALEDVFEASRVDLVVCTEAPPFLALEVISGEILACTDPDEQARYELYIMRRAGDLAPLERERRRMILEEGAR